MGLETGKRRNARHQLRFHGRVKTRPCTRVIDSTDRYLQISILRIKTHDALVTVFV